MLQSNEHPTFPKKRAGASCSSLPKDYLLRLHSRTVIPKDTRIESNQPTYCHSLTRPELPPNHILLFVCVAKALTTVRYFQRSNRFVKQGSQRKSIRLLCPTSASSGRIACRALPGTLKPVDPRSCQPTRTNTMSREWVLFVGDRIVVEPKPLYFFVIRCGKK